MSVSKPSIWFSNIFFSIKWRNKFLIHNINLTRHRKSACCLQLLVFLEIWVIALFWHWRTKVFPKGCCHHDLKALWIGYKSVNFEYYRKYEVNMARILFNFIIYPSCERVLKKGRVKSKIVGNRLLMTWFFWLHRIINDYFSCVFYIVPKKVLLLKYRNWVSHYGKLLPLCKGGRKCKNKIFNQSSLDHVVF